MTTGLLTSARRRESPPVGEANLGWTLERRPQGIIADWRELRGLGAYRGWQTGGRIRLDLHEQRLHVTLVLDGTVRYVVDGVDVDVRQGELLMVLGGPVVTMAGLSTVTALGWVLTPAALGSRAFRGMIAEPILVDETARSPIAAVTNALLNAQSLPSVATCHAYERAVEQLIVGALLDRPRSTVAGRSLGVNGILLDAQQVIEERFRDPSFNVRALAAELHVSLSTLHRPYRMLGTSPRAEIVKRRLREALALMDGDVPGRGVASREVAERSGFGEMRYLRAALAAQATGPTSGKA